VPDSGYQEFAHTADWGIHVWAEDLVSLLITAAEGMFDLLDITTNGKGNQSLTFDLPIGTSREVLLVNFLNELLYLVEREEIMFDSFEVKISGGILMARVSGENIISQSKEIKAVTFHKLAIEDTVRGVEARIVFDV
jgi:SHS2 domain-containing protein